MLLILKGYDSVHVIEDIKLDDGFLPAVGSYHPVWLQDGLPQIEPALWFKTDVVTCVQLDVHRRVITWSTQPITGQQLAQLRQSWDLERAGFTSDSAGEGAESEMETIDLDASYDEMFEASEYLLHLQSLVKTSSTQTRRERKRSQPPPDSNLVNKIIVKLLHCYLLPCLKVKPAQLPIVSQCFSKQEDLIGKIDLELEKKMTSVAKTKKALHVKRQTMVEQFQDFKAVMTYPKDVLLILESQFQEDIRSLNNELDKLQDRVNLLKEDESIDKSDLAKARAERDDVLGRQVKFLMARENVINAVALECPRSTKNNKAYSFFSVRDEGEFVVCDMGRYDMKSGLELYSKINHILQTERDERTLLIAKKNLMISVREAIRETQISLQNGEVTTGSSSNKTRSRRATDVLHGSVPEQWLTLTEKVSECLSADNEHRVRHYRFVQRIKDKLTASISVARLAYRETTDTVLKLQRRRQSYHQVRREIQSAMMATQEDYREVKHEVATLLRSRANSCLKFRQRVDSIVQMDDERTDEDENKIIQEQIKNEIRLLQAQIHAHFDTMSSELQIALDEQSEVSYYKIWLCYEFHFYEDLIHDLVRLYHLSYRLICTNLKHNAAFVTFEDLGVQDKWLADLLYKDTGTNGTVNDVVDDKTRHGQTLHVEDVKLSLLDDDGIEMRAKAHSNASELSTSTESDIMENLNCLVKRLSVYCSSPMESDATEMSTLTSNDEAKTIVYSEGNIQYCRSFVLTEEGDDTKNGDCTSDGKSTGLESNDSENDKIEQEIAANRRRVAERLLNKNQTLPAHIKPPSVRQPASRSHTFRDVFAEPMATVHAILGEDSPLNKLQSMTKCIRQIQTTVSKFHDKLRQNQGGLEIIDDDAGSMMCCDDFLTILTLILLHLDGKSLSNLYPHIVMLTDMMAPFLVNGLHSNSLTHFYGAYQIIFSIMVADNAISTKML